MEQIKRQIAYKFRIGDVLRGKPVLDNERFSFLELGDKQIIRVNIVANIIDKFMSESEKKYLTFTIDDASGQIRIKIFGDETDKYLDLSQGNTVMVIGTLRFFNNELYINPEIIKIKEPLYLLVRKLELQSQQEVKVDKEEVKAIKDQIIEMIKAGEKEGGIDTDKIIMSLKASPDIINQEIQKMLEDGIAYEPRPGKIRFLG